MSTPPRVTWVHYAITLFIVAAATGVRFSLEGAVAHEEMPFLLYGAAVMAAGWRGGFGPGLLATLLSAAVTDAWFYTPDRLFLEQTSAELVWILVFVLEGVLISVLCDLRLRSEAALERLSATLERRVEERTAKLEQQTLQLRWLAHELTEAEQRERQRVAEVLHDHLQQLLVAAKLRIATSQSVEGAEPRRAALGDVVKLLDDSIQATRSLTAELRPPVLYEKGLCDALTWLAEWMRSQHSLSVSLDLNPQAEPASERDRILLFQCCRELLFNVVKYADVSDARLELSLPDDGRFTRLAVVDRGRGFDPSTLSHRPIGPGGYGLFSIGERLKVLGGRMEVHSEPGRGTQVELWVARTEPGPGSGSDT